MPLPVHCTSARHAHGASLARTARTGYARDTHGEWLASAACMASASLACMAKSLAWQVAHLSRPERDDSPARAPRLAAASGRRSRRLGRSALRRRPAARECRDEETSARVRGRRPAGCGAGESICSTGAGTGRPQGLRRGSRRLESTQDARCRVRSVARVGADAMHDAGAAAALRVPTCARVVRLSCAGVSGVPNLSAGLYREKA